MKPDVESLVRDVMGDWKRRGSRSWKETAQELTPPLLLIPAYDLFLKTMRFLHPRGRRPIGH